MLYKNALSEETAMWDGSLKVCWLLVRSRDTREILDQWKVPSTKGALRKAAGISSEQYSVLIRKDLVCLGMDESPNSVM
jgi:hypothetical protein